MKEDRTTTILAIMKQLMDKFKKWEYIRVEASENFDNKTIRVEFEASLVE